MGESRQQEGNIPNHRYTHERGLLVQQLDREIILPLEGQRFLASYLGARGEDRGGYGLGRSSFFRLGSIRRLDVIHVDIGDLDILGLELAAETGTSEAGTEDSGFIGVYVDRNLVLSNSGPHGLLNHRRSGCATGEDNRRNIFLQKEMSRRIPCKRARNIQKSSRLWPNMCEWE